jgi:hypothetical protein
MTPAVSLEAAMMAIFEFQEMKTVWHPMGM